MDVPTAPESWSRPTGVPSGGPTGPWPAFLLQTVNRGPFCIWMLSVGDLTVWDGPTPHAEMLSAIPQRRKAEMCLMEKTRM